MTFEAILFDCDGVLVDSETITNRVLHGMLNEAGWAISEDDCMRIFVGHTVRSKTALIEAETRQPLTDAWMAEFYARRNLRLQAELGVTCFIAVMGNLNPLLRDTADFTHKLWDHLFIMSDFQLDVDSPYPQPSRQELTTVPRRMPYSSGHIEYKHYGKYVERMIRRLADEKNPQVVSRTVDNLARYMRTKSYEYNQEHPNNEVIIKDIKKMSGNAIQIDEVALNNIRSDYKQPFMAHPQKGQKGQKGAQQRQQKNRNQHQSRNFNGKNGGARHNTSK